MKILKNSSGLTLIELIMSAGIMVMVLTVLFAFFSAGVRSWKLADTQMEVQQNARIAFDWLSKDIKIAKEYKIIEDSKLKITTYDGGVLTYYKSGDKLMIEKNGGHNPVANYIDFLKFEQMPEGTIKIDIRVKKDSYEVEISTKVKPPVK
ncbi:MAG: hypothetical protein PWP21_1117 [Thermosediminibacterales bacterium]|nr:hypothetical protein [Thermosediminibacterales bacterium]